MLFAVFACFVPHSSATANPISSDDSSHRIGLDGLQTNKTDRTVYIGEGRSMALAVDESPSLSVGRAGDLMGRPVALIKRVDRSNLAIGGRANPLAGSLDMLVPARNTRLTSTFGARRDPFGGGWRAHSGVDLAASYGTPVLASGSGLVSAARWQGGYGLLITLDHGGGIQTRYGHLSRLSVNEGQRVNQGDLIGFVGSTGRSTGPHLHYEVRENGSAIDPMQRARR